MKHKPKNALIAVFLVVVVVLVVLKLFSNKKAVAEKIYKKDPDTRVAVTVDTALNRPLNSTKMYLGSFEANREVSISAETQGHIIADRVKEGDKVHTGELLAEVDHDGLLAERLSALATYENAKANLERYQNASVGEGVSQMQVDQQQLTLKNAQSQLDQIDKQLKQSRIQAPFSGNVTAKKYELGAYVSPGVKLVDIADLSFVKLNLSVPEGEIDFFSSGKNVSVQSLVYPAVLFKGTVDELVAKADNNHNYTLKIRIKNESAHPLLAGMYGSVENTDRLHQQTLTISRSSLLGSAKNPQVFIVEGGAAQLKNIQTGRSNDRWIEVTKGLKEGDLVVNSGQVNLSSGSKVSMTK